MERERERDFKRSFRTQSKLHSNNVGAAAFTGVINVIIDILSSLLLLLR